MMDAATILASLALALSALLPFGAPATFSAGALTVTFQ